MHLTPHFAKPFLSVVALFGRFVERWIGSSFAFLLGSVWLEKCKCAIKSYAAVGTALLMIAAAIMHISRGEIPAIGINLLILLPALIVAWYRKHPSANR